MADVKIDHLPKVHHTAEKPLHTRRVVGERSAIRIINFQDRLDMQRYRDIDHSLPEEEFDTTKLSDQKLIAEIGRNQPGATHKKTEFATFGVAGWEDVSEKEKGKLQGFVSFYENEEVKKLVKSGYIEEPKKHQTVWEVAYARHADAPQGQMASALRQVCEQLGQIESAQNQQKLTKKQKTFDKEIKAKKKMGLTLDEEIAKRQKFDQETAEFYSPQNIVTAYVNDKNEASRHVLDAAGFVQKGPDPSNKKKGPQMIVYVLDWEKLNERAHQAAHRELFPDATFTPIKIPKNKTPKSS